MTSSEGTATLFSRPRPPAVPNELLELYGPPEAVFGPNMRFRRKSIGMGIVLVLLGVGFFVRRAR